MLGAGIINRVEAGDRAADATHFEVKKNADGRRVAPHHLVHQIVELDRHRRFFRFLNYRANPLRAVCCGTNFPTFPGKTLRCSTGRWDPDSESGPIFRMIAVVTEAPGPALNHGPP